MSSEGSFENSVPMIGDTCPFPPPAVPDDETYNTSNYYTNLAKKLGKLFRNKPGFAINMAIGSFTYSTRVSDYKTVNALDGEKIEYWGGKGTYEMLIQFNHFLSAIKLAKPKIGIIKGNSESERKVNYLEIENHDIPKLKDTLKNLTDILKGIILRTESCYFRGANGKINYTVSQLEKDIKTIKDTIDVIEDVAWNRIVNVQLRPLKAKRGGKKQKTKRKKSKKQRKSKKTNKK